MSSTSLHLPALLEHHNSSAPYESEHRLDSQLRLVTATSTPAFRKESKAGNVALELIGHRGDGSCPVYGLRDVIKGKIFVQKTDTVSSVVVNLDGRLHLQEIGGAGKAVDKIIAQGINLWPRENISVSPAALEFSIPLPATYARDGKEYPLPPTIDVHLSGVPGFRADVAYTIAVHVYKSKSTLFGNLTSVSTPFVYFPRLRPLCPIPIPPPPSFFSSPVVRIGPEWEALEASMESRSRFTSPINVKLFIPAGRTYSKQTPIPFRLHITSNALSLASFLPCSPTNPSSDRKQSKKGLTRVFVIRQVSVDARNAHSGNVKSDIFKSFLAGEAVFRRLSDGQDWVTWEGEITLDLSVVKVGSFKAPGLWLRDLLILSIVPPNPLNSPLKDLRKIVPIRIVTEPHDSQAEVDQLSDWWDGDVKIETPYL